MTQRGLFGDDVEVLKPDVRVWRGAMSRDLFGLVEGRTLGGLIEELKPERLEARMYGKTIKVPRAEAWWGPHPYSFGGRVVQPRETWPPVLLALKEEAERVTDHPYDSCFVNVYEDGRDYIAWHADDEPWIGPWIASVSFGAARKFSMKLKTGGARHDWWLDDGDVLLMGPGTQEAWLHSVPRTAARVRRRLNLTFRQTR